MLLNCKDKKIERESGEVMLEGMIVMVVTVFILVWLLGLAFLYYQRYTTTIVTNDAAVKIASTYNNLSTDIVMGYTTTENISNRKLYRNFINKNNSDLQAKNQERAASYIRYILNKANFANVVDNVDVNLEFVNDSLARKHVRLTTTCTYNTPFGEIFNSFGMDRKNTYQVVSCAECVDISDYISTVTFAQYLGEGKYIQKTGFINSVVKLVNSLVKLYNTYSKWKMIEGETYEKRTFY